MIVSEKAIESLSLQACFCGSPFFGCQYHFLLPFNEEMGFIESNGIANSPQRRKTIFWTKSECQPPYIIFDIFRCFKTLLMGCGGKYPPVFSRLTNMVIPLFCDQRMSWDMGALCHMMIDVLSCSVCSSRFDAA